jgi:hypothetical protein
MPNFPSKRGEIPMFDKDEKEKYKNTLFLFVRSYERTLMLYEHRSFKFAWFDPWDDLYYHHGHELNYGTSRRLGSKTIFDSAVVTRRVYS